tara:strand:- start:60 stop:203 length:144 start_codon:yes stop_codon:yes gene_type:complete
MLTAIFVVFFDINEPVGILILIYIASYRILRGVFKILGFGASGKQEV